MPKSVEGVMHEFKHGALHSGSKSGPVVRNRKQAIAIALSEQRQQGKGSKVKTKVYGSGPFSNADMQRGYRVVCDANHLSEMDVDRRENVPDFAVLAKRRESTSGSHSNRKVFRRSESSKVGRAY